MRPTILVALLMLTSAMFAFSQVGEGDVEAAGPTQVSWVISQNTNWTAANSPYIVVGNILVEQNVTLTINPGVTVKFAGRYSIRVEGQIHAKGTSTQGITFTSDEVNASAGDWDQIEIANWQNVSAQIFENTTFMYGTNGLFFNFVKSYVTIDVKIRNCTFRHMKDSGIYYAPRHKVNDSFLVSESTFNDTGEYGIYIPGSTSIIPSNPYIVANNVISDCDTGIYRGGGHFSDNCTITGNRLISNRVGIGLSSKLYYIKDNEIVNNEYGISISTEHDGNDESRIIHNVIHNNTNGISVGSVKVPLGFMYNDVVDSEQYHAVVGGDDVSLIHNWWGTTNTTEVDSLIYDYYDDFNLGAVTYTPYLISAVNYGYSTPSSEPDGGDIVDGGDTDGGDITDGGDTDGGDITDGGDMDGGDPTMDGGDEIGDDEVDDNDSEGDPDGTETPATPGEGSTNSGSHSDEGVTREVWAAVLTLVVLSLVLVLVIHVNRKRRQSGSTERGPDRVPGRRSGLKASGDGGLGGHKGKFELEDLKDEVLDGLGGDNGGVSASAMRSRLRRMKSQGKIDGELYSSVMEDIERIEKEDGGL